MQKTATLCTNEIRQHPYPLLIELIYDVSLAVFKFTLLALKLAKKIKPQHQYRILNSSIENVRLNGALNNLKINNQEKINQHQSRSTLYKVSITILNSIYQRSSTVTIKKRAKIQVKILIPH